MIPIFFLQKLQLLPTPTQKKKVGINNAAMKLAWFI
jgi:hypothetical protein